jgi:hypothetical protein
MAINIPIFTSFNDDGIKKAQGAFAKMGTALPIVGAAIAAAAGAAVAFGTSAVKAASNFNETISKTEVVFGAISAEVKDFSKTAARELGISRTAALDAAATFAIFGKSAGLAGKELANFSTDFVKLAADLASFNNTSVDEAITALGAALRGENEPIRKYGVLLNDAALKAAALELGIYRGTGALTAQQKVLAAQKVIYEQTGDAQGDFARTSGGLAGQMKILSATVDDVKTNLGRALIPVVQTVVTWFNNHVTPAVERVTAAIGEDGFGAGVQQMIAEFKRAGMDITPVLKTLTLATAGFINVIYRGAKVTQSSWLAIKGDLVGSAKALKDAFGELIDTDKLGAQFDAFASQVYDAGTRMSYGSYYAKRLAETAKDLGGELDPDGGGGAGGGAGAKVKRFSELVRNGLQDALTKAVKGLEDAKQAFADFAQSVSESITSALNFGDAQDVGKETGKGFLQGLRDQVAGIADYANKVRELLRLGLSQQALQQVLDAGQETGIAIADQLIAGGATAIAETNQLVDSAKAAGDEIGLMAAQNFMQAGIDAAKNMVDGITAKLKEMTPKLMAQMDAIAARMKRTVNIDVVVTERVNRIIAGIPAMANGGIVTGPTLALIGEAGPEAVVPLSQMSKMGGGITVNVTGGLATSAEIGEAVVNSLRQYNQTQGPIPVAVA